MRRHKWNLVLAATKSNYSLQDRRTFIDIQMKMLQLSDFRLICLHSTNTQKKVCGYLTWETIIPFLNLTPQFTAQITVFAKEYNKMQKQLGFVLRDRRMATKLCTYLLDTLSAFHNGYHFLPSIQANIRPCITLN